MKIDACLSHKTDDWKTPTWLYEKFMKENYIDCFKYKSEIDETKNYYFGKKLFINPPFSKMKKILKWLIDQIENENKIALLIPARTDTEYFYNLCKYSPYIIFIKGRLNFNDTGIAPFPSILMLFNYEENDRKQYINLTQEELKDYFGGVNNACCE